MSRFAVYSLINLEMKILSTKQTIELLRNNAIFQGSSAFGHFEEEDLKEAIKIVHVSQVKPGDIIFKQGDQEDSIILLLRGQVDVYVTDESGSKIHIATVQENNFFGEMAVINETHRMAAVRASSDCLLGTIHSIDFWNYFRSYPALAKNLLGGVTQRLRDTDERLIERLIKEKEELEKKVKEKTEQLRQKDLQLIEMDRIAGIGTLAAGIAHEINNPLGFVKSSVGFLEKAMDKMLGAIMYWDDKPVSEPILKEYRDYLAQINFEHLTDSLGSKFHRVQRGIERIMRIVNSLRRFSRLDMETIGKIDINQSMEDAVEILSSQAAKDVEFIKELQKAPLMKCSPSEINQCLLHVVKNALDAVDHKGIIKMWTSYNEDEDQIIVRIVDNGKGMSPEVVKQAFNPFFTTKAVGSGTGVGLSLTERIIKRHGGMINISSKEGEGTTVTMTLPVVGELSREQLSTGVME